MWMTRPRIIAAAGLALAIAAMPIYIAEGSLHIADRPAADSRAADYLARVNDAGWSDASMAAADGVRLSAWFLMPREFNGGALLLLHGVGDSRVGMTEHAPYLLHAGYAVLLPDSRGHGASGGKLVTYGLLEARDAAQWAQWMAAQPAVERTYALGESMGAAVAIQSLAYRPGFRAVVAECSFARFSEISRYRVSQRGLGPLAPPVVAIASWYARLRYGFDVMQASPLDALRGSATPVLLIHGAEDTNIPPGQSRQLHQANPASTELWEVPGARHVMAMSTEPQEYTRRVRAWFGEH
jgi:dipeptidyl aminopeptidase/acylaminoacyl peptidase